MTTDDVRLQGMPEQTVELENKGELESVRAIQSSVVVSGVYNNSVKESQKQVRGVSITSYSGLAAARIRSNHRVAR